VVYASLHASRDKLGHVAAVFESIETITTSLCRKIFWSAELVILVPIQLRYNHAL